jgi:hypothetical protein
MEAAAAWPMDQGATLRRYIRLPGSVDEAFLMIDHVSSGCASGCKVYARHDHLGSTVATTDTSGDVVDTYAYDEYGNTGSDNTGLFGG